MRTIVRLIGLGLIILSVILSSCKKKEVPIVTTSAITNITGTTAIGGGTITDEGSGTVIERGVCWSTEITPTIADNKTINGYGAGTFISNISGLNGATTYCVRAYATNKVGTGYGIAMSFSTLGETPTASTQSATNITTTSATINGTVNANYLSTIVTFEYGITINYGNTITAIQSPIIGNTDTGVSSDITGLTPGTTYHFRIKTVNTLGTVYGSDDTFTTLGQAPTVITEGATSITTISATLNGSINAHYLTSTVTFEYGITSTYGQTVTATQSPVTGSTATIVNSPITGLTAGTDYHYRIVAVNSLGTTYGNNATFSTVQSTVNDVDGNYYNVITIGTQVWMGENLKTTRYKNGEAIPKVTNGTEWSNLTAPGYCWYNNNEGTYKNVYGALYNWHTVNTGKLCPTGWHVPTDAEWTILSTYLGGESVAGGKLKETGTTHWMSPNLGASNESGFTALPGGDRSSSGTFYNIRYQGYWWSSTEGLSMTTAFNRPISNLSWTFYRYNHDKILGFSVRCLRD
jgi:uncharacterized protein (TIGR02145 family)